MANRLKRNRRDAEESEIDLTPMLDVVFIMLIFFIVTASFVSENGFLVNRPPPPPPDMPPPPPDAPKNAVFVVTETDEILLDGRRIDIRQVRANIERIGAENPQASVVVRAHELSKADTYIGIVDQAEEAFNNRANFAVSLITYGGQGR